MVLGVDPGVHPGVDPVVHPVVDPGLSRGDSARAEATRAPSRRLDVQGLRAVAVILVVGHHAGLPLPGGFVGVDVFFVISGFVITSMLQREWDAHGRIRFGRFYLRRVKRLTPALALMVSVTVLLSALLLSPSGAQQSTAQTAVGAMVIVANAVIARTTGDYFDAPADDNALLHTWSLSVEEQFYLGFPLVLVLGWMLARRLGVGAWRVAALVVTLVAVLSFVLTVLVSRGFSLEVGEMLVGFYGPATRVWEFAAGALLALVPGWATLRSRRAAAVVTLGGACLIVASVALISAGTVFPGPWTLLPVVGTALVIRAGGRSDHLVGRALRSAPMVRVGDWSYSIYLWHWPFIVFAATTWPHTPLVLPLAAALSFAPAIASYTWLEEPVRSLPRLRGPRMARLLTACLVPAVAVSVIVSHAASRGYWSTTVRAHQAAVLDTQRGCHRDTPVTEASEAACTFGSGTGAPIYLVGDSHARHFGEGVIRAGAALDRPVVISTASSCPFVDVHLRDRTASAARDRTCRTYVEGTMAHLRSADPGVVVLAASDLYWRDDGFEAGLNAGNLARDVDSKLVVATQALERTIRAVEAAGHRAVLVETVPRWSGVDEWTPASCTVLTLLTKVGSCEQRMPVERVLERQGGVRRVAESVAESTGVVVVDPWRELCPRGWCSTVGPEGTRYKDTNHITVRQSGQLADEFVRALAAS